MNPLETTGRAVGQARKLLAAKEHVQIAEERLSKADLMNELAILRKRNTELEVEIRRTEEMMFRPPFYFRDGEPNPFCKHCCEVNKKIVHLDAPFEHTDGGFGYPCGNCEKVYRVAELLSGTAPVPVRPVNRSEGVVASVPLSSRLGDLFKY